MASTSKTIGFIALIGGAAALAWYFINRRNTNPSFQNTPPAPTTNTQNPQFMQWATLIMATFGNIAALWKPGGPFYQFQNQYDEVIEAVQDTNPNIDTNPYDWSPDSGGYGWA